MVLTIFHKIAIVIVTIIVISIAVYVSIHPLPTLAKEQTISNPTIPTTSSTSPTTSTSGKPICEKEYAQIVDGVIYIATFPQEINETYTIIWMSIELQISIKNVGDKIITIKNITVDGYDVRGFTPINLRPNMTYNGAYVVDLPLESNITIIPPPNAVTIYDPNWERGTEHEVVVYYSLYGEKKICTTSATITVM